MQEQRRRCERKYLQMNLKNTTVLFSAAIAHMHAIYYYYKDGVHSLNLALNACLLQVAASMISEGRLQASLDQLGNI